MPSLTPSKKAFLLTADSSSFINIYYHIPSKFYIYLSIFEYIADMEIKFDD